MSKSRARPKAHKWIKPQPLPDDDRWAEDELPFDERDQGDNSGEDPPTSQ